MIITKVHELSFREISKILHKYYVLYIIYYIYNVNIIILNQKLICLRLFNSYFCISILNIDAVNQSRQFKKNLCIFIGAIGDS